MKGDVPVNVDEKVAAGFGDEWSRFDQSDLAESDKQRIFQEYFAIFPWNRLPSSAIGADFGCGSGRWATLVAPRVKQLICVDASEQALEVARRNLSPFANCSFVHSTVDAAPIEDASLDFGYSLGVLHHVPDTAGALVSCVRRLKPGAPLLLYLYYRFDNRPIWYRLLWTMTDVLRMAISRLPHPLRFGLSQVIAVVVYWPLARTAWLLGRCGLRLNSWPLEYYAHKPFYVMRTDALDRFGTRLEQRFSRAKILEMMHHAGLDNVTFNEAAPFWCAVGYRVATA